MLRTQAGRTAPVKSLAVMTVILAMSALWAVPVGATGESAADAQMRTLWLSGDSTGDGVAGSAGAAASAAADAAASAADAAAPRLTVIEESADGLVLSFELPALQIETVSLGGRTYQALGIEGGDARGELGEPMLPTFSRFVRIPARSGVEVEVMVTETVELSGMLPLPSQPDAKEPGRSAEVVRNEAIYARHGYGERPRASVGEPGLARDLRLVPVTFSPVRCNPAEETIEVARRMEIRVSFAGEDLRNTPSRQHQIIPASFDRMYRELVVNYGGPRDDQTVGLGSYVIVCPSSSAIVEAVEPLAEWRARKGFDTYLATTAETGSSSSEIRNWLMSAYQTWDNPPEYITLIGDTGGSVALPCFSQGGGETDHDYSQLDGGDLLADAHLGRISVESVDQLEVAVAKIIGYESAPYTGNSDWFTSACLVGDPSSSGPTTIQAMQWLKARLLDWGYTRIDTVFTSPFEAQMRASLNSGVGAFGYRGYWHMSGWDTGDIFSLYNDHMLPYCVNLTCDTGSFSSGTAISEAWLRAGTVSEPTGGIGSIGTATIFTHTRYNNCMNYGVWRSIFWEDNYSLGASLTRGKYELYLNYYEGDPGGAQDFTHWNNLMGDPATEMWTGFPEPMTATHDPEIAQGANGFRVLVESGGFPLEGAYVHIYKDGELFSGAYTGPNGYANVPLGSASLGDASLTVTKHDHMPYLATVPVVDPDRFVAYESHTIDDDGAGGSAGNGDGLPNPTERIEIPVQVSNLGTLTATDVTGTIASDDLYVTILDGAETFGTLAGGATAWSQEDFDIELAPGAPSGHVVSLGLTLESGADSWFSLIQVPVVAAAFRYVSHDHNGFGTQMDPGESGTLTVALFNEGDATGQSPAATLVSGSTWVTVTDESGTYPSLGTGQTGSNGGDTFGISIAGDCFDGHIAPMALELEFSGGARDTVHFALSIGTASQEDPTGPDAYGYYAFDDGDTGYPEAPTYEWVEIAANHGGPGTSLGLGDFGWDQDDLVTVDLPFEFDYYGETFDRVTICSNGWMAMGMTWLVNYRNWNIPAPGAPPFLIAPMWDNFYQNGDDQVYHWYDEANHRYIVQWSRLRNMEGDTQSNFEAILYDPAHHTTDTGDGAIVFQYETFNNSDYLQQYSTIGIQNGDNSTGVMYGYYNYYNAGADPISSGTAIRFVPVGNVPRGTLTGTVVNLSMGGEGLADAEIHVLETGHTLISGEDGTYGGTIPTGTYTLVATHAGFTADTAYSVPVIEGETTERNFALLDIAGPAFHNTTDYGNTIDPEGPYVIETEVAEYSGIEDLSLFYRTQWTGWTELPLTAQGGDLYSAEIPGQPLNSQVKYYLYGSDVVNNETTDPPGAPEETYVFFVLMPIVETGFESGPEEWTHTVVSSGFEDQWHLSDQRNHTPGGGHAWKFGDQDDGEYANLADGALLTPTFELAGTATVEFWHWIDTEVSGTYPGYAYDGGLIEYAVDGGAWTQIEPVGGYPYRIREGSTPGPFPAETEVFGGQEDWTLERIELPELTGTVQLRFRFGSDGAVAQEGWFIDDVLIIGSEPDLSDIRELPLVPERVMLHQNQPNPFRSGDHVTAIRFELPETAPVSLKILDVSGRLVRTLVGGSLEAGPHTVQWDGRNDRGEQVGSGVFFYVLSAGKENAARQMLLLR